MIEGTEPLGGKSGQIGAKSIRRPRARRRLYDLRKEISGRCAQSLARVFAGEPASEDDQKGLCDEVDEYEEDLAARATRFS